MDIVVEFGNSMLHAMGFGAEVIRLQIAIVIGYRF